MLTTLSLSVCVRTDRSSVNMDTEVGFRLLVIALEIETGNHVKACADHHFLISTEVTRHVWPGSLQQDLRSPSSIIVTNCLPMEDSLDSSWKVEVWILQALMGFDPTTAGRKIQIRMVLSWRRPRIR